MNAFSLSHLADHAVARGLASAIQDDRTTTATLLAYLAEADTRKLYVPEGYASLYLYCVREFHMSEDTALKRISVARVARKFPAVFAAVADGRLGLSATLMLAPHLTIESADELLAAAARKTNAEIKLLLAERFPEPDLPTLVQALSAPGARSASVSDDELAVRRVVPSVEREMALRMEPLSPRPKLAPLSPGRFAVQVTLEQQEYDDQRRAQELLAHVLPSGDAARVIGRALRALVVMLEKRKFGKTDKPRPGRGSGSGRTIPARVRRVVSERDGGQCTFVGGNGKRCEERKCLEFDHAIPVARGGEASVAGVRLRCRVHNHYEAEQVFGEGYMHGKREAARQEREQARAAAAAAATRAAAARAAEARAATERASEREVTPWLRALGLNLAEARRAAAHCAHIPEAPLEERVRVVLRSVAPKSARRVLPVTSTGLSLPT